MLIFLPFQSRPLYINDMWIKLRLINRGLLKSLIEHHIVSEIADLAFAKGEYV